MVLYANIGKCIHHKKTCIGQICRSLEVILYFVNVPNWLSSLYGAKICDEQKLIENKTTFLDIKNKTPETSKLP